MPALSPTMEEGTLAKWLVKEGDKVASGDLLAEIETDKATMEFEAVDEGTIISLAVAEGADGVKVGTVIALLAAEGEDTGAAPSKPAKAEKSEKAQATESTPAAPQPRPAPELAKPADASSIASETAHPAPAHKGARGHANPPPHPP